MSTPELEHVSHKFFLIQARPTLFRRSELELLLGQGTRALKHRSARLLTLLSELVRERGMTNFEYLFIAVQNGDDVFSMDEVWRMLVRKPVASVLHATG